MTAVVVWFLFETAGQIAGASSGCTVVTTKRKTHD